MTFHGTLTYPSLYIVIPLILFQVVICMDSQLAIQMLEGQLGLGSRILGVDYLFRTASHTPPGKQGSLPGQLPHSSPTYCSAHSNKDNITRNNFIFSFSQRYDYGILATYMYYMYVYLYSDSVFCMRSIDFYGLSFRENSLLYSTLCLAFPCTCAKCHRSSCGKCSCCMLSYLPLIQGYQ